MSTIMMCPKCGGAQVSIDSNYYGKRCGCRRDEGGVATMISGDSSTSTAGGHKFCCKCGADVTQAKRMKDHSGSYWCYECGAADQLKKGQGVSMVCPDCKKHFRPTRMVKHGERYICEGCDAQRQQKRGILGRKMQNSASTAAGKSVMGVALLLLFLVAGAAAAVMYAMDLLPLPG